MSKADILAELPNLERGDRQEILERIWDLEECDLLQGSEPSPEEKKLLDRELEEYQRNPNAGSSWEAVEARLRKPPAS
jgi:putative addiction module component (TIGR02574 family)